MATSQFSEAMATATDIIKSFEPLYPDGLPLLNSAQVDEATGQVYVVFPGWVDAIAETLRKNHGPLQYPFVLTEVMRALLGDRVGQGKLAKESVDVFLALIYAAHHTAPDTVIH
jgi:hypothetical protein